MTAKTPTQKSTELRQRRADRGLVRVDLYLHPDDAAKIRKTALALNVARLTKEMKEDENDDSGAIPSCDPDRPS